jgi:hypothetical protein
VVIAFVAAVRDGLLVLEFESTALNAGRLARRVGYVLEELLDRARVSMPAGFHWQLPRDFVLPELPHPPELIDMKAEIFSEVKLGAHLTLWLYDFVKTGPREVGSRDAYTDYYVDFGGCVTFSAIFTELPLTDLHQAVGAHLSGPEPRRLIRVQLRASLGAVSVLAGLMDVKRFAANHVLLGCGWEDEGRTVLSGMVVR